MAVDPNTISAMYQSIMGQAPAQDTLDYFSNDLNNNGKTLGDLSNTLSAFVQNNGGPIGSNFTPAPVTPQPDQLTTGLNNLSTLFGQFMQNQSQPPDWMNSFMSQQSQTPAWATTLQNSLSQFMQPPSTGSNGGLGGLGGWGNNNQYTNSPVYHPQPTNGFQGWGNSSPFRPTF